MDKKYNIGLIVAYINKNIGSGFGLKNDAILYNKYLKSDWNILFISPYTLNENEEKERREIINKCNVIIGFEEMGDEKLISYLKNKHNKIKILVPNLEVMDNNPKLKWYETIKNIDMLDIIISKVPCLNNLIEKFIQRTSVGQNNKSIIENNETKIQFKKLDQKNIKNIKILNIGHICAPNKLLDDEKIYNDEFYNCDERKNIIHFAGSSPWKNTYENCLAGLEILNRFNLNKLIIKITSFKDGKFLTDKIDNFDKLQKLCDENKDKIELIMNDVITDIEKYNLYKTCRLALCCSYAEGFGHYIIEAAYYGCLIITTDGIPMNCLLTKKNTFELAKPEKQKRLNYGIKYITNANEIVIAANRLNIMEYNKDKINDCIENYNILKNKFKKNIKIFSAVLKILVENIYNSYETKEINLMPIKIGSKDFSNSKFSNKLTIHHDKILNKKIIFYNPLWLDNRLDINLDNDKNNENKSNENDNNENDNNENKNQIIKGGNTNKLDIIYNFNSAKINCLIARKYLILENQKNKTIEDKKNILTKYINLIVKKYKYILLDSLNYLNNLDNLNSLNSNINNLINNLY